MQALRERLAALSKDLKALNENNPGDKWTPDCQAKYDAGMAEYDTVKNELARHQALLDKFTTDALDASVNDAADRLVRKDKSPMAALHAKWLRGGDNALNAGDWATIRATMSTTTGSEGGYTVATEIAKIVADALKAYGGVRDVATVMQTAQGNPMSFSTSDGTSETGEQVDENAEASDDDIDFGTVPVNCYKYSSKVVPAPIELLQDSSVDIEAFINQRLVNRLGRITNTRFTTGSGTSQPKGVVTAAAAGKVGASGQTTTVIVDDLIDLEHSVDPAYRKLGKCSFMMHDATFKAVKKLKDSTGRPIFFPGYQGLGEAAPDTILGYPVTINQDMAVMAASAKSILFGDFTFYYVRDALSMQMHRFTDSAYAKKGQVGFLMFARCGGNLVDVGGAIKYYQNAAS
jgi:HK97 family phage major capsid protein